MSNQYLLSSTKIALVITVLLSTFYSSIQASFGAILTTRTDDFAQQNSSFNSPSFQEFISSEKLTEFLLNEQSLATLSNSPANISSKTQNTSQSSSISFESIMSSLTRIKLNETRSNESVADVPTLPQVEASDVYKDIYDFGTTSSEELSEPVSSALFSPLPVENSERSDVAFPNFRNASVQTFGGIQGYFVTPLRQAGLPSANRSQAGQWGDKEVDVFFASLPEAEVADVDTFMRTIYRTSPSDMVKRLDESLDTTIDTEFDLMPSDILPTKGLPSDAWRKNL